MADFYDDVLNDGEPSATADAGEKDVLTTGRIRLEKQIQALQDALERRSQMPFDPMMMSVAAGLLKPTKTGSFGESLGYAAEGAVEAAEKERARRSELENMKLELALKQYELAGDVEGQRLLGQMMTGQAPTIGGHKALPREGGAPVSGAPMEVTEGGPKQDLSVKETVELVKQNPSSLSQVILSPEKVAAIYRVSPKYGTIAQKMYDNQVKMAGVKTKEQEVEQKEYDMVEVQNPVDPGSTLRVSRRKARELDNIDPRDMNAIYRWMASTKQPGFVGKDFSEKAPEGFKPPLTKSEREAEEAGSKARAQKRGEESVKQEVSLIDANRNAIPVMQSAENIRSLAKSNPKAFDLMQGTDFKDAMARTISQGLNTPWGSVGIDMRPLNEYAQKLKPEDRSAFMMAAQNFAVLQLLASKLQQGQGAVSDYERSLFGELSIGKGDNSTTMRLKAEALVERAKFDQQAYSAYRRFLKSNKNATYEDFVDVESGSEYAKLLEEYNNKVQRMRNANAQLLSGGKAPATSTAKPPTVTPKGGSLYQRIKEESQQ